MYKSSPVVLVVLLIHLVLVAVIAQAAPTGNVRLFQHQKEEEETNHVRRHLQMNGGKMWNAKSSSSSDSKKWANGKWNTNNKRRDRPHRNRKDAKSSSKSSKKGNSQEGLLDLIIEGECPASGPSGTNIDCALLPGTTRVAIVDVDFREQNYCCDTELLDQEGLAQLATFILTPDTLAVRRHQRHLKNADATATATAAATDANSGDAENNINNQKTPPLYPKRNNKNRRHRQLEFVPFPDISFSQCNYFKCEVPFFDDFTGYDPDCRFVGYEIAFDDALLCGDISDEFLEDEEEDQDGGSGADLIGSITTDSTLTVTFEFEVSLDCEDEFGDCTVTAEAFCDPITVDFFPGDTTVVSPGSAVSIDATFSTDDPTLEGSTVFCFIDFNGNGVIESIFTAEITVDAPL
jgi:hypothetical protein